MNQKEEKQQNSSFGLTVITGFAIFTTLFGAANFMIPPTLGIIVGKKWVLASLGFIFTAVVLPLAGLVGSFLFEGDYKAFFYRLGKIPGALLIGVCMFIIGPGFVFPRMIHLCYEMLHPFTPWLNLFIFSLVLSLLTFVLAYRPTKLIDILGRYITPIKMFFVGALIILGFLKGDSLSTSVLTKGEVLGNGMLEGYGTLDLLGTIFFGSVFLDILKKNKTTHGGHDIKELAKQGLIASCIGGTILALVYTGMILLGALQGAGLEGFNPAQVLSAISIRIIGTQGGIFGALAIIVACLATMIALSTVISSYIKTELARNKIGFIPSLVITLSGGILFSLLDLTQLMDYSKAIAFILYPVLIVLTLCNVGYKLFGFNPVKIPVTLAFVFSLFVWFGGIQMTKDFIFSSPEKISYEVVIEDDMFDDDGASQA